MTSYYTQIPTLQERVHATQLVIVGRIGKVIETETEYHDDKAYVRTTFEVMVESVLKGKVTDQRIAVQVLGGKSEQGETPMQLPMRDGGMIVLMLANAEKQGVFVPYLGSAFAVTPDLRVELRDVSIEKLDILDPIKSEKGDLSLDELKKLVNEIVERGVQHDEPLRSEPAPIMEMPTGHKGAGQPGVPEIRNTESD